MEKCGTIPVPEKHGKNSGSSGDGGLRGMTVSLDKMPNQGKVKVSPERSGRVVDPDPNPGRVLNFLDFENPELNYR